MKPSRSSTRHLPDGAEPHEFVWQVHEPEVPAQVADPFGSEIVLSQPDPLADASASDDEDEPRDLPAEEEAMHVVEEPR